MRRRPRVTTLLALGVAVLVVGCGGRNNASSSGEATATVAGPQATNDATVPEGARGTGLANDASGVRTPAAPRPDPAPARVCDGRSVLCVDAAARASTPDGTATQPFGSVGQAVAVARPGSVIQVAQGVYGESLTLTEVKDVNIIGGFAASGDFSERRPASRETVLQGDGNTAVIAIAGSTGVRIEGFRLTGGGGRFDGYNRHGGGIDIDETSANVTIVGNRIVGNAVDGGADPSYALGGGIASAGKKVSIVGNEIEDNRAGRGAGVAAAGETVLEGNTIRNNVAVGDHGGGLYLFGKLTVVGNRVEGNRVGTDYSWGGGITIYGDDSQASLRGNVVTANTAVSAGSGVFVDDGADATLIGELYYANTCAKDGGDGLFVDSGGETVTVVDAVNVTIANHDCRGSSLGGNGLLAEVSESTHAPPKVTVTNSIFWNNRGSDVKSVGAAVEVSFTLSQEPIKGEGNLKGDPMFADAPGGDFRLRPSSPAVDAGNPGSSYDAEPEPNGRRIDLGHTGNTPEAKRTP